MGLSTFYYSRMKYIYLTSFGFLAACSILGIQSPEPRNPSVVDPPAAQSDDVGLRPTARPVGGIVVSAPPAPINPEAALGTPEVSSKTLGTTVASLGNPAEPGLWMKTPLVSREQMGEVTAAGGTKVSVTLIPMDGPKTGGSQLSLQAMQALGVPLTALPEVAVSLL